MRQSGSEAEGGARHPSGRTARLTATPADGYRCVRWIGGAAGTSARVSLRINEDKAVIAVLYVVNDRDKAPMIEDGAMFGVFPAGRIVARGLGNGGFEFAFIPTGGERVLSMSRFFPVTSCSGGWLRSTVIGN